ncbi:hypothetical protein EDD29_5344 [Actinocorallia herbida]|uniref:Uncharacterized protein n=1 Tax=Actinocorallia herbida TaxID=58109 RepID=A0A3N1D2F4_9ACTN|nr:hypothetical protein [Actinocorallia herbida]ROO87714.1 hypothetical protein EDD29_5344 [Actinocorallia herbida]
MCRCCGGPRPAGVFGLSSAAFADTVVAQGSFTEYEMSATSALPGAPVTFTFTARLNLLGLGALPASATRTTSTPADPTAGNDTHTANCTALTSLIITC